jgi:hypothetical protein
MNTVSKLEKLPLLSELSEDQARGDILQIYQEIRRLSAVPMVALIWRHGHGISLDQLCGAVHCNK